MKKITKQTVKDYMLFGYVVLTQLGMYSAAMFYAGTQFVHADSQTTVIHSPKAAR